MDGAALRRPADAPQPRVLAALRPRMLELARDRAAGAHPYFVPPEHTVLAREILGAGRLLAPEQAVVLETDPATAGRSPAQHMATTCAAQLHQQPARLGFADEDFADGGSDRLVDAIVAWGDRARSPSGRAPISTRAPTTCASRPLSAEPDLADALVQLRLLAPALGL